MDAVSQHAEELLTTLLPDGVKVVASFTEHSGCWTWLIQIPDPKPDDPNVIRGVMREYVPTPEAPEPTDDYFHALAAEISAAITTGAPV